MKRAVELSAAVTSLGIEDVKVGQGAGGHAGAACHGALHRHADGRHQVRQLEGPQRAVCVRARTTRGDCRLGRGREGDEGRRHAPPDRSREDGVRIAVARAPAFRPTRRSSSTSSCWASSEPFMRAAFIALAVVAGLASMSVTGADVMGPLAERYVRLVLAVGQHDPDFVDAYYGPPAWKPDPAEARQSTDDLRARRRPADPAPGSDRGARGAARTPSTRLSDRADQGDPHASGHAQRRRG